MTYLFNMYENCGGEVDIIDQRGMLLLSDGFEAEVTK